MRKLIIVLFVAIICALSCNDNGGEDQTPGDTTGNGGFDTTNNPKDTTDRP